MIELDQEIIDEFMSEFRENIENAIHYILQLENNPEDGESVHALFRNFHTIKGNASVVGFEKVVRLSHETETLLDGIREQTIEINPQIIETLLMSADALTALMDEVEGRASFDEHNLNALINTLSGYLPHEVPPPKGAGHQFSPVAPLAFYLRIVNEASQIFDQIVFLAMSGRFENGLMDIHEKTARLSGFIEVASLSRGSNHINLFQDYMMVIKTHNLPFSEHNFGLFKNLFLTFTNNLVSELAGLLGIRLVTRTDLYRLDGTAQWHESFGKKAGASPLYVIIDLSDKENLDSGARARVEKAIKDVCRASHAAAFIDPFKQAVDEPDTPCFDCSLEALHHIIEAISHRSVCVLLPQYPPLPESSLLP